jgi:hypothetical protein
MKNLGYLHHNGFLIFEQHLVGAFVLNHPVGIAAFHTKFTQKPHMYYVEGSYL